MASVTLKPRFPVGTTVAAYRRWMFGTMPVGPPQGQAVAVSTVQTDSTVSLTGLTPGVQYTAHGLVDGQHRYVNFLTEQTASEAASSPEGKLINGDGAPADDLGEDGQWYFDASTTRLYGPKENGTWGGVYAQLGGATAPSATGASEGTIKLAGDLGGTSGSPTVPGLATKAALSHQHVFADVANLQTTLDSKAGTDDLLLPFSRSGTLAVAAGTARIRFPFNWTIVSISVTVGTAPTGASLLADVHKNGTTVFTTQANRPTITTGLFVSGDKVPDITTMTSSDYLTVDIDQVGSTVAGADLTGVIRYRKA